MGRIGTINKDISIIAAQNTCQDPAPGGVTIDGDDASATFGGVVYIVADSPITLTNLILTNGSATIGGIIYASSSNVVLDNTDLTYGESSSDGGCMRVFNGTATLINDSEITDCATTSTGNGGGVSLSSSSLFMFDASRIGDFEHGNTSTRYGGGVALEMSSLYMYEFSRIRSNTADDYGGGVSAGITSTINLYDSAVIGWSTSTGANSAEYGGGVYLGGGNTMLSLEDNSAIQYNNADEYGGGIYMTEGSHLYINNASVLDNEALDRGAGIYSNGAVTIELTNESLISENDVTEPLGYGGGLYLYGEGSYITITNSSILTNTSTLDYGGMRVKGVITVTLEEDSSVSYNQSLGGAGGGIGIYGAAMTIENSRVEHNSAATDGGGIYINDLSTLSVIDSRIEYNTADQDGGGIYNMGGEIDMACLTGIGTVGHNTATNGSGGGIYDESSNTLSIEGLGSGNCYINSNYARQDGGGIYLTGNTTMNAVGTVILPANTAHDNGGALFMNAASQAIFDDIDAKTHRSAFHNNRASYGNGGAIYAAGNSRLWLYGARMGTSNHNISEMGSGGAIYLENSTLDLYNSRIVNSEARENGGAIAAYTSTVTITSVYTTSTTTHSLSLDAPEVVPCAPNDLPYNWYCNEISNNIAEGDGGGIYLYNSTSVVANTAILTNTADIGGAVEFYLGTAELSNSLISANESLSALNPSIVFVNAGALPLATAIMTATHNTIAGNLGDGIYYAPNSGGEFNNNIVWGNDSLGSIDILIDTSCNDTQGTILGGLGDISIDPLFITTARGYYRLGNNSPAVNRCTNSGLLYDLDGNKRLWGFKSDMGAFEVILPTFLPIIIR